MSINLQNKSLFFLFLFSFTLCSLNISDYEYPKKEDDSDPYITIAILNTNDIHGSFYPSQSSTGGVQYTSGGLEYMSKYISILREEWGNRFLWFDSGDQFQGGLESKMTDGQIMSDFFNELLCKGSTIGNHEWDFGQEFLFNRLNNVSYDVICANIKNDSGSDTFLPHQVPTVLHKIDNITIGIIGISTVMTPQTTKGNLTNINFIDYEEVIPGKVKELEDKGANAIILLSHAGVECYNNENDTLLELKVRNKTTPQGSCNENDEIYKLLKRLKELNVKIDAVMAGHKHVSTHHWIYDVPVVSNKINGAYASLYYFTFEKKSGKLMDIKIESPIPVCEKVFSNLRRCASIYSDNPGELTEFNFHNVDMSKDPTGSIIAERYRKQYEEYAMQVLTKVKGTFEPSFVKETALGNFFADYIQIVTGADIGIVNVGDLRTTWTEGNLTIGKLYGMSPFENLIVTFEINGKDLKRMVKEAQAGQFGFYVMSGLKLVTKIAQDGKHSLVSAKIFDGLYEHDILDEKTYTVGTIDFLVPVEEGVAAGDDFADIMKWLVPKNLKIGGYLRDGLQTYLSYIPELNTENYYDENNPRMRVIVEHEGIKFALKHNL